jgi:trans-2,3-dihydro-3-hydroxyanthranilate isomerase
MVRDPPKRYVTVDVFTDSPFSGNPLAVVLDARGLSAAQMQAIAREFNYSESAFVLPAKSPEHTAQVRIFTPTAEIPFAGHPNIGTAFALAHEGLLGGTSRVVFEEAAGLVPLDILTEGGLAVGAELTAPEALTLRGEVPVQTVADCLGLDAAQIVTSVHGPQVVSVGLPFLVVELGTREALRSTRPHMPAFARLPQIDGVKSIYAYTRDTATDAPPCDLQARMFSPFDGIGEDPATGSATAAVAALLAHSKAGAGAEADVTLRIRQGVDMGRPSLLFARGYERDGAAGAKIGGRCVLMMRGSVEASFA